MGAMAALSSNNMLEGKYVYGIDGTPEAKEMAVSYTHLGAKNCDILIADKENEC